MECSKSLKHAFIVLPGSWTSLFPGGYVPVAAVPQPDPRIRLMFQAWPSPCPRAKPGWVWLRSAKLQLLWTRKTSTCWCNSSRIGGYLLCSIIVALADYTEGKVIDQDKEKEFPGYNWIVKKTLGLSLYYFESKLLTLHYCGWYLKLSSYLYPALC